jgi:hypothetical protein
MKYRLNYLETTILQDIFLGEQFNINFNAAFPWSKVYVLLTDEQATIMKLKFPDLVLFREE